MKVKPSLCVFQLRAVEAIVLYTVALPACVCAQVDDNGNRSLPRLAIFLHQHPFQEIVKNRYHSLLHSLLHSLVRQPLLVVDVKISSVAVIGAL